MNVINSILNTGGFVLSSVSFENTLLTLLLILLPLSFISERLSNFIKLYLPSKGFLSIGNIRVKETNQDAEKIRERKILMVSLVAGIIVAFGTKANLFTLIKENATLGWQNRLADESIVSAIFGCLFTAFFLSWGSKFWHDLLGILLYVKNVRKSEFNISDLELQNQDEELKLRKAQLNQPIVTTRTYSEELIDTKTNIQESKPIITLVKDTVSLKRIDLLHPKLKAEALSIYEEILERQLSIRITDGYRSIEEQNTLYEQGRTKPGPKVTNVKGGFSYHNYGLALDFCLLFEDGKKVTWDRTMDINKNAIADWEEVVHVFKNHDWEWGGDWTSFKDYPHFQKTFGFTTTQLLEKVNSNQVDAKGYVNI
jgi:hypothetical protein